MTTFTLPQPRIHPRETDSPTTKRRRLWLTLIAAVVLLVVMWAVSVGVTLRANMALIEQGRPPLYGHVPVGPVPLPIH